LAPAAPEDPLAVRLVGWAFSFGAAVERHEGTAGRVNPANRQLSGEVGNLWVIAGQNSKL
jgi:hypothetical protein